MARIDLKGEEKKFVYEMCECVFEYKILIFEKSSKFSSFQWKKIKKFLFKIIFYLIENKFQNAINKLFNLFILKNLFIKKMKT